MISYPNAKINIGLFVLNKRQDGFHNITSVFYPIDWCDALEILPNQSELSFESYGVDIPGDVDSNLCLKAYHLLNKGYGIKPVKIVLRKNIPIGAGLGGGSADAAFALKMLNELYNLELSVEQLEDYAGQLGSDCPFFIQNKPCLASEKGTVLTPLDFKLPKGWLLTVNPKIHVSTKEAYAYTVPKEFEGELDKILIQNPISKWSELGVKNDFEESVFKQFDKISELKQMLASLSPAYVSMTGSGASVFAFFETKPDLSMFKEMEFRLQEV